MDGLLFGSFIGMTHKRALKKLSLRSVLIGLTLCIGDKILTKFGLRTVLKRVTLFIFIYIFLYIWLLPERFEVISFPVKIEHSYV